MSTLNLTIVDDDDDGCYRDQPLILDFNIVGYSTTSGGLVYDTFLRFGSVSGLSGVTINSAVLSLGEKSSSGLGTAESRIYADDQESPGQITDTTDYETRTRTTANVEHDLAPGTDPFTKDIASIIQELADSYDPDAIMVFVQDDGTDDTGSSLYWRGGDYGDAEHDTTLDIDYSAAVGGATILPFVARMYYN